MRVMFAAAEMAPLVRVGGLGEVAGGLTKALREAGVTVDMVLPDYFGTALDDERVVELDVPEWAGPATARTGFLGGYGELTLVTVPDIRRSGAYGDPGGEGYWDNDRRFFAFSAAVAALTHQLRPDVIHVNDWHTGAALAWIPDDIGSVASIHNLAYQGDADRGWLLAFGDRAHAYDRNGRCNPLAGSLILADRVVAVSPNYANEIRTDPLACGMSDILGAKAGSDSLVGIVNGIDVEEWNPWTDPALVKRFRWGSMTGKRACKEGLLDQVGLPKTATGPLFGFVSRLVDQKGVEYVIEMARFLDSVDGALVVLGNGDRYLSDNLHQLAAQHPDRVAFHEGFDLTLSHRIFGGIDAYLMPSRFEPCGLAQMQAMTYGALPVVTDVGGLHDTVIDADRHETSGTGIVARAVSAEGMVDALHRTARLHANKRRWTAVQQRAMAIDWSWSGSCQTYIELYESVISRRHAR
jgi:starch synthase